MPEPVAFPEANAAFKSNTEGVGDLPCFLNEEMTIACWKLTDEERRLILESGHVWLGQMNYGKPLQPQAVWFKNPFTAPEVDSEVTQ